MKIVVIGGSGLIGSKVVAKLTEHGHEAVPASPSTGVDILTGAGLSEVLRGAQVLVDVSNSPSFAEDDVMNFFQTSTTNLTKAAADAGVQHYVALSIVGTDRGDNGYFRAKLAQEELIRKSGLPYTIVHATQFFEFLKGIADSATQGDQVRLPDAAFQPIAAEDVATAVGRAAAGEPVNGPLEIGGPERSGMATMVRKALAHFGDPREVISDPAAGYWGAEVKDDTLVPGPGAWQGEITLDEWLAKN